MTNQTTYNQTKAEAETPCGSARVLILDDEPCIADLMFEMLQMLGFSPTKCSSPQDALDLLDRQQFDVILSDFRMPQMNGDAFFRRAVAGHANLRTRFVFLTGDSTSEDSHRFLMEQGCRHLTKPFDIASVMQVISEVLEQQGAPVAS